MSTATYVRFFEEFGIEDVPLVGGKNASLGEMFQKLSGQGVRVPHGFAITAQAYRYMLDKAGAWDRLHAELDELDPTDVAALARKGKLAREIVYGAGLPDDLAAEILDAYRKLQREYGEDVSLAVRSSATAEDLPTASFAGQQDSYLNIKGEESLLDTCRRCFASLFTDRAIHYRVDQGFDHFKVSLSIGVMKMVRSDISSSGVMFSIDTESGFRDAVFVTGAYGLGENVVQGAVDPDEFYVHKPTFLAGHRAVLRRLIGDKAVKMIFVEGQTKYTTRNIPTPKADRARFCLTDEDVLELAGYACTIEAHYGRPMDMEWAKDGLDGKLYIVQARPETVASQHSPTALETYVLEGRGEILTEGRSVGEKIASGTVKRIENPTHLSEFKPGQVLVADTTTPDWEPVMKIAAAIITNRGGRTCHAAIVARELGIPAVVGTGDASTCVPDGEAVTVSCAEGDSGRVYRGAVAFHVTMADLGLRRGENGLKVYAMCEIPNNVILIDEFAKRFDGFSIGSNDLTQLTLGVDRDSEIVAFDYDERDEGVKEMIRLAVEGCRRNGIHSGLCGQAPSDYPDMAEFLVRLGIESMSLNLDTVIKTTRQVLQVEHEFAPSQ